MKEANKIKDEECPYLREIWTMGYDEVQEDHPLQELLLIRKADKFIKRIPIFSFADKSFKIITSRLYDGTIHKWISEADGSCERFRQLITPTNSINRDLI